MPNPSDFESQDDFISACIGERQNEHPSEDVDQSTAVCYSMWEKAGNPTIIRKTHASDNSGMEFILSDATPDRFGDVIQAEGWDLDNFKRNPIALFNHNSDFPIGKWENLRVLDGRLRGHLRMAPEGTSDRIDEIRKLIDAGILRAVSVGFRPIESRPLSRSAPGELFVKSELVETSLVSVPANPNALAIAKSMGISADTMKKVFAEQGRRIPVTMGRIVGKHAESRPASERNRTMSSPLSQRITDTQARIVALKDQLTEHMKSVDDANPDDAATATTEELTGKIEAQEKALEALKKAEVKLASTAVDRTTTNGHGSEAGDTNVVVQNARPFAVAAKKIKPVDYFWRSVAVELKQFASRGKKSGLQIIEENYGLDEATKAVYTVLTRSAVDPATTTGSKWADTLVATVIGDFVASLMPVSVYPALAAKGTSITFGRNGTINLPARDATPTVAGGFVLQGSPIPVKQAAFTPIPVTPHKLGVITTMTREITEQSTPAIEGILRQAMIEDTAVAIDTVLLGTAAGSATQPHGLRYDNIAGSAITETTASVTASIVGFVADIQSLAAALIASTAGNVRSPVWIMNPGDVLKASMLQTTNGDMPFRDELARGTLAGYPVLQTTTGTSDMMYLIDAADFVTATGDVPRFDVSDQALLHMETSPAAISAVGTPNTVAAPIRSLYQTDSLAIRMIMDLTWVMRRSGCVKWLDSMAWN